MIDQQAVFGGGCFWCLDAVFRRLRGVRDVVSGYAGGRLPDPSYEQVCTGTTGHAEVVQVTFDPAVVTYRQLLEVFFAFHDPTTVNRQGPDVGTQYRSVIFTSDDEQDRQAREAIEAFDRDETFGAPVATEVRPLGNFWPAEEYHQRYFERNPQRAYCAALIAPKVAKLRQKWSALLAPEPG